MDQRVTSSFLFSEFLDKFISERSICEFVMLESMDEYIFTKNSIMCPLRSMLLASKN